MKVIPNRPIRVSNCKDSARLTANVTGLLSNTGYAFRAYATNAEGTSYSPVAYVYTLASSNARRL